MNSGDRIEWIDALKGIGILCVMYNHHPDFVCPYTYLITTAELTLFFFLPGYLCGSVSSVSKLMKRLVIPYLFYAICFTCFDIFYEYIHGVYSLNYLLGLLYGRHYVSKFNTCLWLSPNSGPLWFLPCLFFSKLFFCNWLIPKLNLFLNNLKIYKSFFILFFTTIVLLLVSCLWNFVPVYMPWALDLVFVSASFMLLGYVFRKINLFLHLSFPIKIVLAICLFVGYIIVAVYNGDSGYYISCWGNHGLLSVFLFYLEGGLFCTSLSLLFQSINGSLLSRGLAFVGKDSLRLLCIHIILMNNLLLFLFDNVGLHDFCRLIIFIPIVLVISKLLGFTFNKLSSVYWPFKYV